MNIREKLEKIEEETLSKYATLSKNSLGRDVYEEPCELRTIFARDRDRIIHSKAFRRLKHKTQVFLIPEGDHYRTRLTHTLEVSQIARTIAKCLLLNEDLTEAIALGHDLGHTPFGHTGERVLDRLLPNGFEHCFQSVRIVEVLEKNGAGLNLTKEVRDGILNHRTAGCPATLEGKIVRLSDKIAYINHDMDDALQAGILSESDLPKEIVNTLGKSVRERINTLIIDIVNNSFDKNDICQSKEIKEAMQDLRKWLFENLYKNSEAKQEEEKAEKIVEILFNYYIEDINRLPDESKWLLNISNDKNQIVADYIAGMTDDYCVATFKKIFIPEGWKR